MKTSSHAKQKIRLSLEALEGSSWLANADGDWLEFKLKQLQENPEQVDPKWRHHLENISNSAWQAIDHVSPEVQRDSKSTVQVIEGPSDTNLHTALAYNLINAFRTYGHLKADLDPLGLTPINEVNALSLEAHGLGQLDQNTGIELYGALGIEKATLSQILRRLQETYCQYIGYEYQYITSTLEKDWLSKQIEQYNSKNTAETKQRILHRLLESDGLEKHLASQFVGQKRFSIEGIDTLMPILETVVIAAKEQGVNTINMGMAHRGRLNVLINLLGKPPSELFKEFAGTYSAEDVLSGDVKYHKGFKSTLKTMRGDVSVELAFNPSHLEVVSSVVEGITRAKQDQVKTQQQAFQEILPILIHGDASFAGQGVVMETLQLSNTPAYRTGGTIHVVLNNQVGFTTDPLQARSSHYCSDIAKMIDAPIFHVNANEPEAACRAMDLALNYRLHFQKDVIIDLIGYRKYGHNEADEPAATQPLLYQAIRQRKPTWAYYAERLEQEQVIKKGEAEAFLSDYRKRVALGDTVTAAESQMPIDASSIQSQNWRENVNTAVSIEELNDFMSPLTDLPSHLNLQTQVGKLMADRKKMLRGELPLNWGTAETLAYASLLANGLSVRLTGQDTERGTFAHRHAVLHDTKTGETYTPLTQIGTEPARFAVYDSILSEMATMGFEYGYSVNEANTLVVWEAQYGDFVNGAQVVIDQFITAAEKKWGQQSGLTLFLPHGYEGAGPEHSSARLERFLQQCAEDNIQVCAPTTPAQHFHLLRRQLLRENFRKPLVIMTPKSLLRHKAATATLDELSSGKFSPVLLTQDNSNKAAIARIVLCSGKVYYDLMVHQAENHMPAAIIRLEQLYPFPDQELSQLLSEYPNVTEIIWCQEEPKNQGAWSWIQPRLHSLLTSDQKLHYVGRKEAAATAVGSPLRHAQEQSKLVKEALE